MRAVAVAVLAAAMAVWAAPAQAYDFGKDWGYAVVADDPFQEPGSGALLARRAVQTLVRTEIGGISLGKQRPGSIRPLRHDEIGQLYKAVGL